VDAGLCVKPSAAAGAAFGRRPPDDPRHFRSADRTHFVGVVLLLEVNAAPAEALPEIEIVASRMAGLDQPIVVHHVAVGALLRPPLHVADKAPGTVSGTMTAQRVFSGMAGPTGFQSFTVAGSLDNAVSVLTVVANGSGFVGDTLTFTRQ
jgi:hypothetical protein